MTQSPGAAPSFPTYDEIKQAVRVLEGLPVARVRAMLNAMFEIAGSSQDTLDWSDPDRWIEERLTGEPQNLARRIWAGSGGALNPRYFYSFYSVVNHLKLLEPAAGVFRLNERGRRFLAGDDALLRELVTLRSARRRPQRNGA
jgi:restriction system protein